MGCRLFGVYVHAGVDYQVPPTPIELVFETTDSRLPIPINVFEDALLEGPETFILFLSIPANPAQGYRLGTIPSTTITILDNDGNLKVSIQYYRIHLHIVPSYTMYTYNMSYTW